MVIVIIVIAAVVVLVLLWWFGTYNSLIRARNQVDEAYSDIDVQLKRRHDLIPNLVETVKGYAQHESSVFENVAQARASAVSASTAPPGERGQAENVLTQALRSVFAVSENYPELKASENFQALQAQLSDTEDKLLAARRFYNACVMDYNTRIQVFPAGAVASATGFTKRDLFTLEDAADRENPQVKF